MQRPLLLAAIICAGAVSSAAAQDVPHSCFDREGNRIPCESVAPPVRPGPDAAELQRQAEERKRAEAEKRRKAKAAQEALEAQIRQLEQLRQLEDAERLRQQLQEMQDAETLRQQMRQMSEAAKEQELQRAMNDEAARLEVSRQMDRENAKQQRLSRQRDAARAPRLLTPENMAAELKRDPKGYGPKTFRSGVVAHGRVSIVTEDGRETVLSDGTSWGILMFHFGDEVKTGPNGSLQLLLPDNTVFNIGPNSDMELDDFIYDPNPNGTLGKIAIRLIAGAMRWATPAGSRHAEESCFIKNVTVGIRGTDFRAVASRDGNASIRLYSGSIDVTDKTTGQTVPLVPNQIIEIRPNGAFTIPRDMTAADRE